MTRTFCIELNNVSKNYVRGSETVHALQDVSLNVGLGDFTAIVGHSGSGKTTLLNIMGCLDHPSGGQVMLGGQAIENKTEAELTGLRRSSIGFVFQQFFLVPTLTVLENVALPSLFARKSTDDSRARELLDMVGLGKRLMHLPSQLSGGEMQRTAIARALINEPPVVLADEPTGNLDSKNAEMIMGIFEQLNRDGVTIVLVTHNADIVKRCERTVHIEDGCIMQ